MLFSSLEFIFFYLPATLLLYFSVLQINRLFGQVLLILCSLFFYGYWNPAYLPLILGSIAINYGIGTHLSRNPSKALLTFGIVANLGLLGYFKYANFVADNINVVFGSEIPLPPILLPLAISFFTFQQIAYLVDSYRGETKSHGPVHYALFVSFFPQLIAGPIVHHSQVTPQFAIAARFSLDNFAIGLAIFIVGLAKKVFIADNLANYANPVFAAADHGEMMTLLEAWGGALAYTGQLYFDFSGYADMAIGIARMFNIKLPLNFNSPYKSVNIIEFWRRWHITLSTFLRDYLYIPLGGNQRGELRRYLNLLITMLLGGLWHGAGWNFLIWGGMHGLFLVINHLWFGSRLRQRYAHIFEHAAFSILAVATTFFVVTVAWVFFRASSFYGAIAILEGMAGCNGVQLPLEFKPLFPEFMGQIRFSGYSFGAFGGLMGFAWIGLALFIAFFLPNTQQIMARFEPALGFDANASHTGWARISTLSVKTGVFFGLLFALALSQLSGNDEFLYFNF